MNIYICFFHLGVIIIDITYWNRSWFIFFVNCAIILFLEVTTVSRYFCNFSGLFSVSIFFFVQVIDMLTSSFTIPLIYLLCQLYHFFVEVIDASHFFLFFKRTETWSSSTLSTYIFFRKEAPTFFTLQPNLLSTIGHLRQSN